VKPSTFQYSPGCVWFRALVGAEPRIETGLRTVLSADVRLANERSRLIAVVPDGCDDSAAVSHGEAALDEGWVLADLVRDVIAADRSGPKRAIIAIVDGRSQAHGRIEELLGITFSCALAAEAYGAARRAGHPLIALVIGSEAPCAFLAHGYQAHRLLALDSAALAGCAALATTGAPRSRGRSNASACRDIERHAGSSLYDLIEGIDVEAPASVQIGRVRDRVALAIADVRNHPADLAIRLSTDKLILSRSAAGEFDRWPSGPWNVDVHQGSSGRLQPALIR
jgi:hypothetical protein